MFSQVSVILSTGGGGGWVCFVPCPFQEVRGWVNKREGVGMTWSPHLIPVLTSSECHTSARYASYWNAFLFWHYLCTFNFAATSIMPPVGRENPTGIISFRRLASSGDDMFAMTICPGVTGPGTSPGDETCGGDPTCNYIKILFLCG